MSYRQDVRFIDEHGHPMGVTQQGEGLSVTPIRIVGAQFTGTTVDSNFWTTGTGTGGSVTQANGMITLMTGTTANNTASLTSIATARYIGGSSNRLRANFVLDAYHANNKRRLGMYTSTDGVFFELDYNKIYAVTRYNSTDTRVDITDKVALTTNVQKCEIVITNRFAEFFGDDGQLIYRVVAGSTPLCGTFHLPAKVENINYDGSTTNVPLKLTNLIIHRLGPESTQARYRNIKTATTTVCKYSPGTLHKIIVNGTGSTGDTVIIYDNTAGSGTIIGTLDIAKAGVVAFDYNIPFFIGLTVVTNSTTDLTIIYE